MSESIATKQMTVLVQENGIVRNASGRIIAKLEDETPFESEHIVADASDEAKTIESFKVKFNIDKNHRLATTIAEYAAMCAQIDLNHEQLKAAHALNHEYACKMIEASEFFMPPQFTNGTQSINRFTDPRLIPVGAQRFAPMHGTMFGGNPMWNQNGLDPNNQNRTNVFKSNTDFDGDHHNPLETPPGNL
jgi:hypothetical protein